MSQNTHFNARKTYSYGLGWINSNDLFDVTKKHFEKVYYAFDEPLDVSNSRNPIDPFTALFQLGGAPALDYESWVAAEKNRQVIKSLQNAVGAWHQSVLGLADGWVNRGVSGTVYDVESLKPQLGFGDDPDVPKNVIIEVKNKFNTIKASDEHLTHSSLHQQAKSRPNTVAYLVQIVPKNRTRYNERWVPSKAFDSPQVFRMDGATAYDLIFQQSNALEQLYGILPAVLQDVREDLQLSDGLENTLHISLSDWEKFQSLFSNTFGR